MRTPVKYALAAVFGLGVGALLISVGDDRDDPQGVAEDDRPSDAAISIAWLRKVGDILVEEGVVTEHSRSGWHSQADYTVASDLIADARGLATTICESGGELVADGTMPASLGDWTVRVFLVSSGERPAATCRPGG